MITVSSFMILEVDHSSFDGLKTRASRGKFVVDIWDMKPITPTLRELFHW